MTTTPPTPPQPAQPPPNPPSDSPRILSSDQLLEGDREVLIRHGTELYRLRVTRQGKLILQK